MPKPTCSVAGCEKTGNLVRQMCVMHYTRWLRTGDPAEGKSRIVQATSCAVPNCIKPGPYKRGMCEMHYTRLKRTGNVERKYYKRTAGQICAVTGCVRPVERREYCTPHMKRVRAGVPLDGPLSIPETPEEKFKRSTKLDGECLVWTGSKDPDGYGLLRIGGEKHSAHRWAYQQAHGPVPASMDIDHICQNPPCCNINHLRKVTKKQNAENRNRPNQNNKSSGILGVGYDKVNNAWTAGVTHNQKRHWGGRWETREQAAAAVEALRLKLYTHYSPSPWQPGTADHQH